MIRYGIGRKPFESEYLLPTMWSDHISGARTRITSVEVGRRVIGPPPPRHDRARTRLRHERDRQPGEEKHRRRPDPRRPQRAGGVGDRAVDGVESVSATPRNVSENPVAVPARSIPASSVRREIQIPCQPLIDTPRDQPDHREEHEVARRGEGEDRGAGGADEAEQREQPAGAQPGEPVGELSPAEPADDAADLEDDDQRRRARERDVRAPVRVDGEEGEERVLAADEDARPQRDQEELALQKRADRPAWRAAPLGRGDARAAPGKRDGGEAPGDRDEPGKDEAGAPAERLPRRRGALSLPRAPRSGRPPVGFPSRAHGGDRGTSRRRACRRRASPSRGRARRR